MTDRRDVDRLAKMQAQLVAQALAKLTKYWNRLDLTDPGRARDQLEVFVTELVDTYGEPAAAAAAQWYEDLRIADTGDESFRATVADPSNRAAVAKATREAIGGLDSRSADGVKASLAGTLQRQIAYMARATVARNVKLDPKKPRFARVPRGARTCAFCAMLASRGWVYLSEDTAGLTHRFHRKCDCQIVPSWDRSHTHIEGYDPDSMYQRYLESVRSVGSDSGESAILIDLRRRFPMRFTDGVVKRPEAS